MNQTYRNSDVSYVMLVIHVQPGGFSSVVVLFKNAHTNLHDNRLYDFYDPTKNDYTGGGKPLKNLESHRR